MNLITRTARLHWERIPPAQLLTEDERQATFAQSKATKNGILAKYNGVPAPSVGETK